jgi:hypothetical protein
MKTMNQLASRIATAAGLLLALGSACGGQSFAPNDGEAGSAQGGTTSQAGSSNVAGQGHAGRSTGGTAAGGSGNFGGTVATGGSNSTGGSVNPPDYRACNVPSDCQIRGTGCCGVCDAPNLSEKDFIAYNKMYANMFQCGIALPAAPADPAAGGSASAGAAAPIACAPCIGLPPGQGALQYFVPDCVTHECVVEDLRQSPVTACKASDECKVRSGTNCCEACSAGQDFAVRNDGSFEKLVCGDGPVGCLACLPPQSGASPTCADGRCKVVYFAAGP